MSAAILPFPPRRRLCRYRHIALALAMWLLACVCLAAVAFAQNPPNQQVALNSLQQARAVTKSDSAIITATRGLFIGDAAACTLAVLFNGDSSSVALGTVAAGSYLPFSVTKVLSTNTSCATITALY